MNSADASKLARCAVVLSFDRLPLRLLGTYGSLLCQTPYLDRFASEASVFDFHFVEDLRERREGHGWWDGRCHSRGNQGEAETLPAMLSRQEITTILLTDRVPSGWDCAPGGFDEIRVVEAEGDRPQATLFERASESLTELVGREQPFLLWVHSSELPEWPIPSNEYLELYLDELIELPELEDDDDPADEPLPEELKNEALALIEETLQQLQQEDEPLELRHLKTLNVLAAARISELDQLIGNVRQSVEELTLPEQRFMLITSDRGLSLGEEQLTKSLETATENGPLQEELLHIPLIIEAGTEDAGQRFGALSQPADVAATIADWFGCGTSFQQGHSLLSVIAGETDSVRDGCFSGSENWESLREWDWLLVRNRDEGSERLYAKPEDLWQVLDVSAQNLETVDRLHARLDEKK